MRHDRYEGGRYTSGHVMSMLRGDDPPPSPGATSPAGVVDQADPDVEFVEDEAGSEDAWSLTGRDRY